MNGWGYVPLLYSERIGGGDGIGNREAFAETFFRDCGGSGIGGDKVGISSHLSRSGIHRWTHCLDITVRALIYGIESRRGRALCL